LRYIFKGVYLHSNTTTMLPSMAEARMQMDGDGDKLTPIDSKGERTPLDTTADIRDSLGVLVGGGYSSLTDDDSKANVKKLQGLLGEQQAQKLISHALLFNQRDDMKGKSPQERLAMFYSMGHPDKKVGGILQKVKAFGSGPQAGLNDSVDSAAQDINNSRPRSLASGGMLGGMSGLPLR